MPDNEAGFKMRSYCETGLCSAQRCKTCPSKNNETVNLDWVGLSHRYDVNNFTLCRPTVPCYNPALLTKKVKILSKSNFVKSYLRWRPGLFPPLQLYNWIEAGGLTRTELIKFYNFLTPHKEAQPAQLWLVLHWPPNKLNFAKIINWSTSTSTSSSYWPCLGRTFLQSASPYLQILTRFDRQRAQLQLIICLAEI